ncbi:hypothetical protein EZV62_014217 [Acer yangbiense]|uniref:GATA-type domain-containing protein n=1 Tax=Acer yangbiense TaxID=1000413 RepID=A0A5C7HS25_9ROSI|nr:hypothetical protein EZV62_014217 [Acer yangbiense]
MTIGRGSAMINDALLLLPHLACQTFAGIFYRPETLLIHLIIKPPALLLTISPAAAAVDPTILATITPPTIPSSLVAALIVTPLQPLFGGMVPESLCNACGIRFKKEERRATAANANSSTASGSMEQQYHQQHQSYNHHHNNNNPWVQVQHTQTQKMPCYSPSNNEFRFIDDNDQNSGDNTGIPFLSWRLNVADRPSLVHDFTR